MNNHTLYSQHLFQIFQIITHEHVSHHFKSKFNPRQLGLIKSKSTITNRVAYVYSSIFLCSFSAPGRSATHFEFSNAFHLFPHALLLRKSADCGKSSAFVTWFHSFLNSRISHVRYRDALSTPYEVLSAVPQGSVLATLPFTVFINDLCSAVKYSNDLLFGDEVKIYREIRSSYDRWLLQSDTNNIRVWCISN